MSRRWDVNGDGFSDVIVGASKFGQRTIKTKEELFFISDRELGIITNYNWTFGAISATIRYQFNRRYQR